MKLQNVTTYGDGIIVVSRYNEQLESGIEVIFCGHSSMCTSDLLDLEVIYVDVYSSGFGGNTGYPEVRVLVK